MTDGRWNSLQRLTDPIGWLKNALMNFGLEWFVKRFYGTYPAVVLDNKDPQGRGRVRAIIPAIGVEFEEDVGADYWADACMNGLGTDPKTGQSTGLFYPPDVGTNIWVTFQYGDTRYPVYMGGYMTTANKSDTFASEDALKKGIRTKTGHYIRMNDDPDDLHLVIGRGDGKGAETPMFLSFSKEGHAMLTNILGSTLYMNGEKPETTLMSANDEGEVTSMLMLGDDKITLATKSGGAYGIDGKDHTINGNNVVAVCEGCFHAKAGAVKLGKNATEPAVKGLKFAQWSIIHQHISPAPIGVTIVGPTPPVMMKKELSSTVFVE